MAKPKVKPGTVNPKTGHVAMKSTADGDAVRYFNTKAEADFGGLPSEAAEVAQASAPTRNLIQLSVDHGVNKMRAVGRVGGEPSEVDLDKRLELRALLSDLNYDLGAKSDGSPRQLIARYGRVIGVEPDEVSTAPESTVKGWRYQTDYGMLVPSLNTAVGREWRDRIHALGVLGEHVDGSTGPGGGTGSISYTVQPLGDPELPAKFPLALAGPSTVTPGNSIGYTVSESHMSRAFVDVEDRPAVAGRLAAEHYAEHEAEGRHPAADYPSSTTEYWMTQFDAYDIFEEEAPADFTDLQRQGFDSVSLEKLRLDLDHQSFYHNAGTVGNNERLARNTDGPYRRGANAEHQAKLDQFWDARADRLASVREQLDVLRAR